jgi:predicted anti-sigma-YlaC factor YlaD
MMQTMDCGEARISLGVYVLGSIDPAERSLVDAHLSTCQDCRDELAGLAGLPALLARVSLDEVLAMSEDAPAESVPSSEETSAAQAGGKAPPERSGDSGTEQLTPGSEPPRELLGAVLDLTAARRRRRAWRTAGLSAAAAVVIAAGAFGGARLAAGNGNGNVPQAQAGANYGTPLSGWTTVQGETGGMYGTVMYRQMGWGTQLQAKVVGIPVGTPCQLVAIGNDGIHVVAGGWTTDNLEGTIFYPASARISPQQVREYQITVKGHPTITIPA